MLYFSDNEESDFNAPPSSQEPKFPVEKFKTLVALLYLLFGKEKLC